MERAKSGLRETGTGARARAASNIASNFLRRGAFPGHKVRDIKYWQSKVARNPESVHMAGFEIHGPSGRVALVNLSNLPFLSKPAVHVGQGNEALGRALAKAFKDHAGYRLSPSVRRHKTLPGIEKFFPRGRVFEPRT